MEKTRLETFSDGVIAIIITIMVLELKVPDESIITAWRELAPKFISYVLSFLLIAIMWGNHHHVFQIVKAVDGKLMWANINLLFWMSLIPFATAYLGEHYTEPAAVALYGVVLSFSVIAFTILRSAISKQHLDNAELNKQDQYIFRKNILSNFL
ncbi:MAG: TMEM175 family protein, partial [Acidobacteriota bacterium]